MFYRVWDRFSPKVLFVVLLVTAIFGISAIHQIATDAKSHSTKTIKYVLYPASSKFIPDELRKDTLEFAPPHCYRVLHGEWTDDALILYTEYNCKKDPQKLTFCRIGEDGDDIIKVNEH